MNYDIFRNNEIQLLADDLIKKFDNDIKLDKYKLLGSGYTANIYEISQNFVLKVYKSKIKVKDFIKDINILLELLINDEITNIVKNNICPNFVYCYYTYYDKTEYSSFLILEKEDGDLKDFFDNIINDYISVNNYKKVYKIFKSMIFQIMTGLFVLNKKLNIYHYDIKLENILYKKINKHTIFEYNFNNKKYYVPTYGYIFMISDFGSAMSKKSLMQVKKILKHKLTDNLVKQINKKTLIVDTTDLEDYKKIKVFHHRLIKKYFNDMCKNQNINELENILVPKYISQNNFNIAKNIVIHNNTEGGKYSNIINIIIANEYIDLNNIIPKNTLIIFNKMNKLINKIFIKIEKYDEQSMYLNYFKKYLNYKKKYNHINSFNILK